MTCNTFHFGPLCIRYRTDDETSGSARRGDQHLEIRLFDILIKAMVGVENRWHLIVAGADPQAADLWELQPTRELVRFEQAWTPVPEWGILPFREVVLGGQHICFEIRTAYDRSLCISRPRLYAEDCVLDRLIDLEAHEALSRVHRFYN